MEHETLPPGFTFEPYPVCPRCGWNLRQQPEEAERYVVCIETETKGRVRMDNFGDDPLGCARMLERFARRVRKESG